MKGEADVDRAGPIRRSPIAGTWYPGEPVVLERLVEELLGGIEPAGLDGEVVAVVSPHAGLRYSGPVAATAYANLRAQALDTVVLVGPSHYVYFQGASLYARGAFETPLGLAEIDEELAAEMLKRGRRLRFFAEAHEREHCLEMQLPFLQVLAPRARIVPILMGDQRRENVDAIAQLLHEAVSASGKRVLLVASSDLSHYKPADVARRLDGEVAARVEGFDPDGLMELIERQREHACGGGPMVAVLRAARSLGATRGHVLHYADSGDVTGDKTEVVGYLAAAIVRAVGASSSNPVIR